MDFTAIIKEGKRQFAAKEKWIWLLIIILIMFFVSLIFLYYRLIPSTQTFGPSPSSSFGRNIPFSDIDIKFSCKPDGMYFSEDSDISCKFIAKSKKGSEYNFDITANIYSYDINKTILNCTSNINVNGFIEKEGYCKVYGEKIYFELPKGDYKISANSFTSHGSPASVKVETSKEVIFRGTLHIMSSYEKLNKENEDGVSIATFLAFIGIIPTAILEVRRLLYENKNRK